MTDQAFIIVATAYLTVIHVLAIKGFLHLILWGD